MINHKTILGLFLATSLSLTSCNNDAPFVPQESTSFLGEINWSSSFGGSGEDELRKAILTADGGIAFFGFTASINGNISDKTLAERDYWLLKTDMDGNIQWSKTYGGSGDDRGRDIIQTKDGGYIMVGYSMSSDEDASKNEGMHDNWIIKADNAGNLLWEKSYGFAGHDHAYSVVEMDNGGYAMAGFLDIDASQGKGSDGRVRHGIGEYWVHRLNEDGTIKWRRYFGGSNNDRVHALLKAPNNGLLLVGFTESNDFDIANHKGEYDIWLVRIDADGEMLWQQTYGGSGIDVAYGAVNAADNSYIIAGSTLSSNGDVKASNGGQDAWVIKVDDTGKLLWEHSYGGADFDVIQGISQSKDGGYWLSGSSRSTSINSPNQGENDLWLIKIDTDGSLVWEGRAGGTGIDFAYGVIESPEGFPIAVGTSESTDGDIQLSKGGQDAWVVQWK